MSRFYRESRCFVKLYDSRYFPVGIGVWLSAWREQRRLKLSTSKVMSWSPACNLKSTKYLGCLPGFPERDRPSDDLLFNFPGVVADRLLDRKLGATRGATTREDEAPFVSSHAGAETVSADTLGFFGLIGAFHVGYKSIKFIKFIKSAF